MSIIIDFVDAVNFSGTGNTQKTDFFKNAYFMKE